MTDPTPQLQPERRWATLTSTDPPVICATYMHESTARRCATVRKVVPVVVVPEPLLKALVEDAQNVGTFVTEGVSAEALAPFLKLWEADGAIAEAAREKGGE